MEPIKHQSIEQPNLYYWVEQYEGSGDIPAFIVIAQVDGYPATEAFDDWFADYNAADKVAKDLALGLMQELY